MCDSMKPARKPDYESGSGRAISEKWPTFQA